MSKLTDIAPRDFSLHPPRIALDYRSSLSRGPIHKPIGFATTMTEATGPTFGHDVLGPNDHDLLINHAVAGGLVMAHALWYTVCCVMAMVGLCRTP